MAKAPKIPDPAEAALFAIEEALSGKATGTDGPLVRPRMPKAALPDMPLAPDNALAQVSVEQPRAAEPAAIKPAPDVLTPPPAANTASAPIAPQMAAANDDRRNSALTLTAMNERASRTPTMIAWLVSLIWLGTVGYYAFTSVLPGMELTGGALASANIPAVIALVLAAIVPVALIFCIASMVRRTQEMRIAARAMTEAALRLTQPELVAADSIFSLGQAVRREVASMGDGIERAVSRASELEALVHSEVAQLERSYTDNELKIRKLLDDLAGHQTNFGDNAEQLRRSINESQETLTLELRGASQRITEQVATAGRQVTGELDERREIIAQALTRAGDSMTSQLSASSADLIERLSRTGETVSDRIAATSADMTHTITDYGQRLVSDITDRSQSLTSQIEAAGSTIAERIDSTTSAATEQLRLSTSTMAGELSSQSSALTQTLSDTGNALISKFEAHTAQTRDQLSSSADAVVRTLEESGHSLVASITSKSGEVTRTLEVTGQNLVSAIGDRSEIVTRTLAETGQGLVIAIGSKGDEVSSTLKATGEALVLDLGIRGGEISHRIEETGTRIADIVASRGDSLASRLVETSNRINQAVTVHGQDLEQSIAATGQHAAATISEQVINARTAFESAGMALASLIDTRATKAEQQLNSHVAEMDERMNGYVSQATGRFDVAGRDMVMALAAQGNRVNESLLENARTLNAGLQTQVSDVASQLRKFDETMGGRLQGVEALLTIHGDALIDRLTSRTTEAATLLENQLHSFDERITGKTTSAVASYETLSNRVEIGLMQRSEQLNEMLVQRSMEVARTLNDGGRALADSLSNRASEIVSSIENQLGSFDTRVLARMGAAADDIESKGTRISVSLERSTGALSVLLGERGEALVEQMQLAGATTVKEITETGNRVSTALETQRGVLSEDLNKLSLNIESVIDTRRVLMTGEIDERITNFGAAMDARTEALALRLVRTTDDLQSIIVDGSEQASRTLNLAGQKLGTDVTGVLSRLNEANAVLNAILAAATDNLESIETGLTDKVKTLEVTMDQLVSDTANTTDRVEKQVSLLREVSGGVLSEANVLSERIQERGAALARAAEELATAQERMGSALESKGTDLRELVSSIETKRDDVENTLKSFGGVLEGYLNAAEERARSIGLNIASQGEATSRSVLDQFEALKSVTSRERERTLVALKAVADETSGQIDQAFAGTTERFRHSVDELRELSTQLAGDMATTRSELNREVRTTRTQITQELEATRGDLASELNSTRTQITQELEATRGDLASELNSTRTEITQELETTRGNLTREMRAARTDITNELEATRAEITRGTISMPREVEAQSSAIRRVVSDQMKAIAALDGAANRDSMDIAQPAVPAARSQPALRSTLAPPTLSTPNLPQTKAPAPRAPVRAKAEPEQQSATGGWLSDLLKKASNDERTAFAASKPSNASSADALGFLTTDVTRLVDQDGLEEAWDSALAGESGAFTRQLYTLQGQQAFDDMRRRYRREAPFKEAVDRYVDEFERMLKTLADNGDGDNARAYLLSDTGKIYTMLAHSAGRLE